MRMIKAIALCLATLCSGVSLPAAATAAPQLSDAELDQLFEVFDADKDGAITATELRAIIVSFRVDMSGAQLDQMMATFDQSGGQNGGDSQLQPNEFAALMQGFRSDETSLEAQMERSFLRFDTNRDGGLDAREVRALMEASGKTISLREAKLIILEADTDGNGRIDTAEFNGTG